MSYLRCGERELIHSFFIVNNSRAKHSIACSDLYIFIDATADLYIFLKKPSPAKIYCLGKGSNLYIFSEKLLSAKISFVIILKSIGYFSSETIYMKNV